MTLGTYDPAEVALIACGAGPISGFASGTFINVEQSEDAFNLVVGVGSGCRTRTNNNSGIITFTLLQSSVWNNVLSGIHETDKLTASGDGILPTLIKDNSGTTAVSAAQSWIVKTPNIEFGTEATNREWTIASLNVKSLVGSN